MLFKSRESGTEPENVEGPHMTKKYLAAVSLPVFCIMLSTSRAEGPPYPASRVVRRVEWHFDTVREFGRGSDQWPMTRADDGNLYAAWGEGNGFANHLKSKQALGVTRINGTPPKLTGETSGAFRSRRRNQTPSRRR